jgi:hypothetical protein
MDKNNNISKDYSYDYQYGFCHYFAYGVIDYFKEKFPDEDVCYYLIISEEKVLETDEVITQNLIHTYIKVNDNFIDSRGVHDYSDVQNKIDEYEEEAIKFLPDVMSITILEGESDDIPDIFFEKNECNQDQIEKDLDRFKSNPEIKSFVSDKNITESKKYDPSYEDSENEMEIKATVKVISILNINYFKIKNNNIVINSGGSTEANYIYDPKNNILWYDRSYRDKVTKILKPQLKDKGWFTQDEIFKIASFKFFEQKFGSKYINGETQLDSANIALY